MNQNNLLLIVILLFATMSCKSKEDRLIEHLIEMDVIRDIEGPRNYSKEFALDSININIPPESFKIISYLNFKLEDEDFSNSKYFKQVIYNYKKNIIKDLKDLQEYQLYKDYHLILEYNIFVNEKKHTEFTVKSSEY